MASISDTWQALSHGPVEKLTENLWRIQGTLTGMSLKRVMTVAKMTDGSLVFHSPIALHEEAMRELESIGNPVFLIVPGRYHRLDAPAYKKRYPALRVFVPTGARDSIASIVAVDGTYDNFPRDNTVWLEILHGVDQNEGVMFVRSQDGITVVLNDAVFNMDRKRDPLGWLFTTVFGSAPGPRVSRLAKLTFIKDQKALRSDLERFAAMPDLVRLIVAHEKLSSGPNAALALRQAASYL